MKWTLYLNDEPILRAEFWDDAERIFDLYKQTHIAGHDHGPLRLEFDGIMGTEIVNRWPPEKP